MGRASGFKEDIGSVVVMESDNIKEINIDAIGRLRIYPENKEFNGIYRLAKEVHWDNEGLFLYSPKPREWSYLDWYHHIFQVIKTDFDCLLIFTNATVWTNVPISLKEEILSI